MLACLLHVLLLWLSEEFHGKIPLGYTSLLSCDLILLFGFYDLWVPESTVVRVPIWSDAIRYDTMQLAPGIELDLAIFWIFWVWAWMGEILRCRMG